MCVPTESTDRYCESFYRPTQCLPVDVTDEIGHAKLRYCYCNYDYCNAATVERLTIVCLTVSLLAPKLTNPSWYGWKTH